MYYESEVSPVLVQDNQKKQEPIFQEQNYSPYLAANLSILNYLAYNDLNFQNLLVLQNLFALGMELDINKTLKNEWKLLQDAEITHKKTKFHLRNPQSNQWKLENQKELTSYPSNEFMGHPAPSPEDFVIKLDDLTPETMTAPLLTDWTSTSLYVSGDESVVENELQYMEPELRLEEEGIDAETMQSAAMQCQMSSKLTNSWSSAFDQDNRELNFELEDGDLVEYPSFMKSEEHNFGSKCDLERFIDLATPTISLSSNATITTDDIWEFYHWPSVYGLQVPFFKGSKSVSLAHFVPSLSAIRLFVPVSPIKSEKEKDSASQRYVCDVKGWPRFLTPIYEFSEKLVPHVRPPFIDRVRELMEKGTAENQIPNVPLRDIHPASWFAVAWYPVYCIPEGKLRTSFLTFHTFRPLSSQIMENSLSSQERLNFKASIIGIKYMLLHKEAWVMPKRKSLWNIMYRTPDRNVPLHSISDSEDTHHTSHVCLTKSMQNADPKVSIRNGLSICPLEKQSSLQQIKAIEQRIKNLQSKAEALARSSFLKIMRQSGNKSLESKNWWHSDFEFFHQRSR